MALNVFLLVFILSVSSQVLGQTCNSPFTQLANECYYVSSTDDAVSWVDARESCLRIGGLLAVLDTEDKNLAVGNHLNTVSNEGSSYWIALNDQAQEGRFVWDGTGTKVTYESFLDLTNSDAFNCVIDGFITNYNWTNINCDRQYPYICQQLPSCTTSAGECTAPFTAVGDGCYNFYTNNGGAWLNAHNYCNTWGSSLLSFDSAEEEAVINAYLAEELPDNLFWIGGYDAGHEGNWYWDNDGYEMNYTNWQSSQPNGGTDENCALTDGESWSDYPCDDEFYFICELPTECYNP